MLEKRTGRDQDKKASPKKSFSGFGLERDTLVFIDMFCISHFPLGLADELSCIESNIINKAKLVLVTIEDQQQGIASSINIRSLIDMLDATIKLEAMQKKEMERKELEKMHGQSLSSNRIAESPWGMLIQNALPHNYIFCRLGQNDFNEYYNTINLDLILALLENSKIDDNNEDYRQLSHKASSSQSSSFEYEYYKWIKTKMGLLPKSKYFGKNTDALNKLSARFIRSLAKLEIEGNYAFNNDISNFEDVDIYQVKEMRCPAAKDAGNAKK